MVHEAIRLLVDYGLETGLVERADEVYVINRLLEALELDVYRPPAAVPATKPLEEILAALVRHALDTGLIEDTSARRDLFDTRLMGCLTPPPSKVIETFWALYGQSPEKATDFYYKFSRDTDYIRRYRAVRDIRWTCESPYGRLDLSVNLAKPEKDPRDIASAGAESSDYPPCVLCRENEGFAGHLVRAARQNHRLIPLRLRGEDWFFQYSPYVYYNEHCIVLSGEHRPMKIDRAAFEKLFAFVDQFPHYFIGSNADLPIVGGSILSHDHFQGGRYSFAMMRAPIREHVRFVGCEDVEAGIVDWPMSVIRLRGRDAARLTCLAERILAAWRTYGDEAVFIRAETGGVPHNTVTPIVIKSGDTYTLDMALRNNITTATHPLGVYHPHAEHHHIKKENIGLIEAMGLAILPPRLERELSALEEVLVGGADPAENPLTAPHEVWAENLRARHGIFSRDTVRRVLRDEIGLKYVQILRDAAVFKDDPTGRRAFSRFIAQV
ncbi:MAG: UDP-glucose--hexose-1-phosphate uridylyltransferase [Christensenellales bacterium]